MACCFISAHESAWICTGTFQRENTTFCLNSDWLLLLFDSHIKVKGCFYVICNKVRLNEPGRFDKVDYSTVMVTASFPSAVTTFNSSFLIVKWLAGHAFLIFIIVYCKWLVSNKDISIKTIHISKLYHSGCLPAQYLPTGSPPWSRLKYLKHCWMALCGI